jgi:hypothetical protein
MLNCWATNFKLIVNRWTLRYSDVEFVTVFQIELGLVTTVTIYSYDLGPMLIGKSVYNLEY